LVRVSLRGHLFLPALIVTGHLFLNHLLLGLNLFYDEDDLFLLFGEVLLDLVDIVEEVQDPFLLATVRLLNRFDLRQKA